MENTQEAYEKSIELLNRLVTEKGFVASAEDITNYKRVWSRDGIIAGLASLVAHKDQFSGVFANTLRTLARHQDHTGRIASNVTLDEETVSFGTTVGRVDATLWYVVGVCQYVLQTGDKDFYAELQESVERALFYLECLELNGRGLLYIPQGGDWADEYITHAYILYDQILYYIALRSLCLLEENGRLQEKAERLRETIQVNYFPKKENIEHTQVYNKALFEMSLESYSPPLPIAYFSAHNAFNHRIANFDNALLLLTDIVDEEMKTAIANTVLAQCVHDDFSILPAFAPVIDENDPMWELLRSNYLYNFKNKPYMFHNGGLWPLVHGFFLSGANGFMQDSEAKLLEFADVLARDAYTFPEYYHGQTFEAGGTSQLGFSAAGYILAYEKIINTKELFIL